MKKNSNLPGKTLLAVAISMATMSSTQALEFYSGGIEGNITSQISMGSSWRLESPTEHLTTNPEKANVNDGDSNYDKGDAISQVFKGSHDLQISYQNYGAFVRGKYWYDFALNNNAVDYGTEVDGNAGAGEPLDDSEFNDLSKFSGAEVLDAFVYGEFELGEMPLDLRLGKQVVSWGESTFILGGVNAINPIDVASFRRPGAEIKEGLIPVNMAYANLGVSDNLSAEAFYQLEYQETVIPGCGTFFSTNDYAPQGCDGGVLTAAGIVPRSKDDKADSAGQFGVALRYIADELGGAEFGFYAMNIHSRAPLVNAVISADGALADGKSFGYRVAYPEDTQLVGVSFATNVGSMALSGEVTHKLNVPVQIKDSQLITAGLTTNVTGSGAPGTALVLGDLGSVELDAAFTAAWDESAATGETVDVEGYVKHDITQVQLTAVQLFDQVGPISRIILLGEAGYTFVHDFNNDLGEIRYDTSQENITEDSWGYRARIITQFNDVFNGVNLTPVIAWTHDVDGYSPDPAGNFREGRETLGFTLKADYLATYNAAISYTQYGAGDNNNVADRDFASITVGMSF